MVAQLISRSSAICAQTPESAVQTALRSCSSSTTGDRRSSREASRSSAWKEKERRNVINGRTNSEVMPETYIFGPADEVILLLETRKAALKDIDRVHRCVGLDVALNRPGEGEVEASEPVKDRIPF